MDSFVAPEPWAMPGYDSDVIMAAGAFVQGSSIELSADGPIKPPYAVYFQGGLTWQHAKLGILMSLQKMVDAGCVKLEQTPAVRQPFHWLNGSCGGQEEQILNIVIVGGGAAGLTAAIFAAGQGHTVTVLEQNEKPGKIAGYRKRPLQPDQPGSEKRMLQKLPAGESSKDPGTVSGFLCDFLFTELGIYTKTETDGSTRTAGRLRRCSRCF